MPLYEFQNLFTVDPKNDRGPELIPHIQTRPVGLRQSSDVDLGGRVDIFDEPSGASPDYIEEFLVPGFTALDDALKSYWNGMRVPTKDSYRMMRVKVAGGDKSLLIWHDDLVDGRVKLPVAALNRNTTEFNPEKFSPPYLAMAKRYTNNRFDRVALVRRPVPFLVDYTLTVWAAFKRDADYILYQILTRFNPLAEFRMFDDAVQGNVQLRFGGYTDGSDKEMGHDQQAKIRYEFSMVAEAWLPLPERVVPTILGHVSMFREQVTNNYYLAAKGHAGRAWEPDVTP